MTGDGQLTDDGSLVFPITGGNVTVFKPGQVSPYVIGQLQHVTSGLTLTAGDTTVKLSNFNVDPGVSRVYGDVEVNGESAAKSAFLFQLDGRTLEPLKTEGTDAILTGTKVEISPVAADLLNQTFKTDAVTPDLLVGIATITRGHHRRGLIARTTNPSVGGRARWHTYGCHRACFVGCERSTTSTITFVAFTTAVAVLPTSSPSSSAASRLISDTIRKSPQASSTCAITPSRLTATTIPVIRLRALDVADDPASEAISGARSSAGSTRWLCWRSKVTRPSASQRRSVSTLTPTAWATSPIRRYSATRTRCLGRAGRRRPRSP